MAARKAVSLISSVLAENWSSLKLFTTFISEQMKFSNYFLRSIYSLNNAFEMTDFAYQRLACLIKPFL
jgi:hypothetical protein